jgi:hypothetical protein
MKGGITMTPEQLVIAFARLDTLYSQKDSFRNWLSGDDAGIRTEYEELKLSIEKAFPGLKVIYAHFEFRETHALIADE